MGGDAGAAIKRAQNFGADLVSDPRRAATAFLTKNFSEYTKEAGKNTALYLEEEAKRNMPAVAAPAPAPTPDNSAPAIDAAAEEQRRKSRGGRASTILTGGAGVRGGTSTARRTLLGS